MLRSDGFTLLELMISVGLALILSSALFMCLRQAQVLAGDLEGLMDRDENLKLAPVLLAQWISRMAVSREGDDLISIGLTGSAALLSTETELEELADLQFYLWNFRRNLFFEGDQPPVSP
jgi:prepilin-type N-terminal cleavage/methylation domain-containing protein